MSSENPSGADNQQETVLFFLIGSSETVRGANAEKVLQVLTDESWLQAKIQSDPHGDMGSWAEMTQPTLSATGFHCLFGVSNKSA
jgi:hypothetical protein